MRGRQLAALIACLTAAFAATAIVLSVSVAATVTAGTASSRHKSKSKSAGITKAEVIALIKQYSKPGPQGAAGLAGAAGATGPAGSNGASGTKGENGLNGAVAGYSASQPPTALDEGVSIKEGDEESPVVVLSKSLPAGSFMASGKVEVGIAATDPGGGGDVNCALVDTPESGSPVKDLAGFFSTTAAVSAFPHVYAADTTLPLDLAVSTSTPSKLAIDCWIILGSGGENTKSEQGIFFAEASEADIQAVQTTTNS